jgi:hypothetical protein
LNEELPENKSALLLSNNNENEQFAIRNREVFVFCAPDLPTVFSAKITSAKAQNDSDRAKLANG